MVVALAFVVAAAAGALARALVGRRLNGPFPWGTLTVNISGSFVLGLLAHASSFAATVFGTGLLGAYTTYSSFARDIAALWERRARTAALAYGLATLLPELKLMIGMVTAAIIIAALYFGRDILIPLALAIFLGFVLDPVVVRLKRVGMPRTPAVAVVAVSTLVLIGLTGLFLANQISTLSAQLPTYQSNIVDKLRGLREKWLLRQVAARTLPAAIAQRPKSMFRAHMTPVMFGPHRPAWVDQPLTEESLRRTGLFDPTRFARELALQRRLGKSTPRRAVFDYVLTAVVATQLFAHLYMGGGLCELPTA